ncbi:bifunctional 2-polyprenyl-6-hydroxyphenol methylase/3-demethylubiquinol 3-O-methyltransferase UbiG [Gammaproteobacteria bacterium AS21]
MTDTPQNVDPSEIAKFEELASRWWDKNSEFKPLHDINPLRVNYINTMVNLEGKTVIDVGCGGGILSESMVKHGAIVTGIDLGAAPLKVAKLHGLESGLKVDYQKISAEDMAELHRASFDVVTCMEMLEHVPDPSSIVRACAKLVKPGGHVFFSTINRNPKSYVQAILGAEHVLKLVPKGTHEFKKFIKPSELTKWTRDNNLYVDDMLGMTYNLISKEYSLVKNNVDVNYIIATHKPTA